MPPSEPAAPSPGRVRLLAVLLSLALFAVAVTLAARWAVGVERRSAQALAPELILQRDQGVALILAPSFRPDVLPFYGSSELEVGVPNLAPEFFRGAPTGFQVCPIGRRGISPILMLQKFASAYPAAPGKKVVVALSFTWFLSNGETASAYAGNFSALQAMELIFKAPISHELRRRIARRMLAYPQTLTGNPLLHYALEASVGKSLSARALYAVLLPMGLLQTKLLELQDHFESVREILRAPSHPGISPAPAAPDWQALLATAAGRPIAPGLDAAASETKAGVRQQLDQMRTSTEWEDMDLLLCTLHELHAQALVLNIPWYGPYYDRMGAPASERAAYYRLLQAMAEKYGATLASFRDREYDPHFFYDRRAHIDSEGWVLFNADMDAFYHSRPLPFL